jgi:hypothetical protein
MRILLDACVWGGAKSELAAAGAERFARFGPSGLDLTAAARTALA